MTAARTAASMAAVLLAQRLVDVPDAAPFTAREVWSVLERVDDLAALIGADAAHVSDAASVDVATAERIVRRFDAATVVAFELDDLAQSGVRVLTPFDAEFPGVLAERLGTAAPTLLHIAGDPLLLARDLIGIVGSRDVSEGGTDAARAVAGEAARHGYGTVTGGGMRGVDRAAMQASLEAGGVTVGVLADPLTRTLRDPETRRAILSGAACLCTPFTPTAPFSEANATARNKVMYALASAVVVVASDNGTGSTWAGATEAMDRGFGRVVAWTAGGAGPGNRELVARGALALDRADALFPLDDLTAAHPTTDVEDQLGFGV